MKLNVSLLAFCMVVTLAPLAQAPTNGLVAYYPFNENGNDLSGHNHHATPFGTINYTTDRHGKQNAAANFDGDDYFSVAPSAVLDYLSKGVGLSVCVWVKSPGYFYPVCKASIGAMEFRFGGNANYGLFADVGNQAVGITKAQPKNEWVFYAFIKNGSSYKFYVNGVNFGQVSSVQGQYNVTEGENLEIGRDIPGEVEYSQAEFDDLRIYNRGLSDAEVFSLYNAEKPQPNTTSGLVAHYKFDGNANNSASTKHQGLPTGVTPTNDRFGQPAKAYQFDGNAAVIVPDHPELDFNQRLTLTMWVWFDRHNPPTGYRLIDKQTPGQPDGYTFDTQGNGSGADLRFCPGPCEVNGVGRSNLPVQEWVQVAAAYDQGSLRMFVNGQLVHSGEVSVYIPTNDFPLTFGKTATNSESNSSYNFRGKMDDIRIYNRSLTNADIAALYASEVPSVNPTSSLIASYNLNKNAADGTGNGYDGIVSGPVGTIDRFGNADGALNFDGTDDFISIEKDLPPSNSYTVSAWVNWSGTGNDIQAILSTTDQTGFHFQMSDNNGYNNLAFTGNQSGSAGVSLPVLPFGPRNTWQHLAVVFKSGGSVLYKNGERIGFSDQTYDVIKAISELKIGAGLDNARFFKGSIDDLKLYGQPLTDIEIQTLYKNEKGPDPVFDKLVAFYPCNGDMLDYSQYQNHGTRKLGNLIAMDRFGKDRAAFYFDGIDDYISIPSSPSLESPGKEITLMAWVKPDGTSQAGSFLCKSDNSDAATFQYRLGYNNQGIYFGFKNGENTFLEVNSNQPIANNKWQHLAVSYDGAMVKFYQNGVLQKQIAQTGAILRDGMPLEIGRDRSAGGNHFKGWLDEIRIFNKALTLNEINGFKGLDPEFVKLPSIKDPPVVDGFDYPIGDRGYTSDGKKYEIPEGMGSSEGGEKNPYFSDNPLKGASSRRIASTKTAWWNEQDVGTNTYKDANTWGVHPGEDWNYPGDDAGEPVYAIADGIILASFSTYRTTAGGYTIVIEHQLLGGSRIYSVYTHVTDKEQLNGALSLPAFQVNQLVKKGELIARIGRISMFPPHLHFEIRNKLEKADIKGLLYQNDNGNGYYTDKKDVIISSRYMTQEEMKSAYQFMLNEGIMDASDFIDENRLIETSNFGNRILLGQYNSSISQVPILFTLKNPLDKVTEINNVRMDFGDPNVSDLQLSFVPNSLKQVGQGKWMFRVNRTDALSGFDISKQYTLIFDVKKSNGDVGQKRASNQVLLQDFSLLNDLKDPYKTYIENGIKNGLFSGFVTEFKPDEAITRGALATFAVRAWASYSANSYDLNERVGSFDDIPETNSLYPFVQTLRNRGAIDLMPVFDETKSVTVQEAAEVICKLFNITKGNAEQLKTKLPLPASSNANQYLNLLLNCFVSKNGIAESVIGTADITNKLTRGIMAKMVVNALRYSVVGGIGINQPGIKGEAITLADATDSTLSHFSIIGNKREVSLISPYGSISHPFKLDTIFIRPGDTSSIGARVYNDANGNALFYHWVSNNGTIAPIDPSYSQIKFTPDGMKSGDTARLYSYVSNTVGGFSEGWVTIIVDSLTVTKNNDIWTVDSAFTNFGTVKVDSIATRTLKLRYPANGQGALIGDLAIADSAFRINGNAHISVTPGEERTIELQFVPKTSGIISAQLRIVHNSKAYPNPLLLSLYGIGFDSTVSQLNPNPLISQFPCDSLSTNGMIEMSVSDTNLLKKVVWYKGVDSIASGRRAENLGFGDYSFTITDTANRITSGEVYLPLSNSLVAEWVSHSPTCGSTNGNLQINVSGGSGHYNYLWSLDSSLNSPKITGAAGEYQVLVSDSLTGCKKSFQERINSLNSTFDFNVYEMQPVCGDSLQSIILRDTNSSGPVWYTLPGEQAVRDSLFRLQPGTYSVLGRDSIGCSAIQSITVQQLPEFRFGISTEESICGNPAEVVITAMGGTGQFQYKWNDANFGDTAVRKLDPGQHQIKVTDGVCSESRNFSINSRNPLPYFTTDSTHVEIGAAISLSNKTNEPATYRWLLNETFVSSSENFTFTADSIKTYKVGLEATVNNCVDTFFQDILVYPSGTLSTCLKRTASSGLFGLTDTWRNNLIPSVCDSVIVTDGDTLTLAGIRHIKSLYIEDGAVLEINDSSSSLILGDTSLTSSNLIVEGKLVIKSGSLKIFGKLNLKSLASFEMYGGTIIIDKNPGDTSGLGEGSYLFEASEDLRGFLFAGGILQIVNPPGAINSQAISCQFPFGDNSTLMLGDGKSMLPSNNPNGFGGDQIPSSIGRLIIDTKTKEGNRHFINKKPLSVKSEIRMLSGSLIQMAPLEIRN